MLQSAVHGSGYTITVQAQRSSTANRARAYSLLVVGLALLAVGDRGRAGVCGRPGDSSPRCPAWPIGPTRWGAATSPRSRWSAASPRSTRVSHVLERSARQIAAMMEQQRNFASDAAHQLRTPLTGIGLRLEELARIGDAEVRQEAEDALAQVERLDRVISALLARARGDAAAPVLLDLGELVAHEAPVWTTRSSTRGARCSWTCPEAWSYGLGGSMSPGCWAACSTTPCTTAQATSSYARWHRR